MGIRYDQKSKSFVVRIRRRGVEIARAFKRKSEAEIFYAEKTRQILEQGNLGIKERHTLAAGIERYLIDEVPNQRSAEKTESNARALLDHISGLYLDQLDEAVKRVKQSVRKSRRPGGLFLPGEKVSPLKPASINRRLAILRRVANLAYTEWHWLDRPIAVRLLPEHNQRHRYLSVSEIQALSEACAEPVNQMVIVAAYTGMRRGELLQLTKTNIQGENLFLGMTKNGKPKLLPILPMYRAALFSWIAADKPDPRTMHKHFIKGAKKAGLIGVKATLIKPPIFAFRSIELIRIGNGRHPAGCLMPLRALFRAFAPAFAHYGRTCAVNR